MQVIFMVLFKPTLGTSLYLVCLEDSCQGTEKNLSARNSKGLAVLRSYLRSSERLSKLIMVLLVSITIFS